tara:strand:+ start:373 stop:1179 length:807 start_codon:yes stop_codon:yes gene_type:complete
MTASGKSNLAHKIAIERNLEIISLDSMAVYKGLDILTDKPSDVMRAQVFYYGIDIAEPDQNFSVVDYLNYLIEMEIPEKSFNKDFLVVGGTGLYFRSLVNSFEFRPTDPAIRAELELLNVDQLLKFHKLYNIEPPETEINKRRLIRNIENSILQDVKYIFPPINIPENIVGVFWNHPEYLTRIEKRTSIMLENGLIEEMNKIENPSKTVLQAIGMNLSNDLEENINLKTNRLAKKQLTWFKQEDRIKIIETTEEDVIRGELENILDGK